MELKIETNQAKPRNKAITYQAIGWVIGNYQPSADNPDCGVLVTSDGVAVPAQLKGRLHHQLSKKFPNYSKKLDLLPKDALWTVYPSTKPLNFELVNINTLESTGSSSLKLKKDNQRKVNGFKLVGQIESVTGGKITIVIRRNAQRRRRKKHSLKYQPFILQIVGSLPEEAVGQIWELEVKLQKAKLVLVKGCCVRGSLGKPKLVERKQEKVCTSTKAATNTLSPESKPAIEQSLVQAVVEEEGRTNGQAGDCEAKSKLQQTDATKPMLPLANAASNKTVEKITTVFERKARGSFQNAGEGEKYKGEPLPPACFQSSSTILAVVKPQAASSTRLSSNTNHSQLGKTQLSLTAQTAQALKQPTFNVKLNERVFVGRDSVTLNKRVLCVDGKPVAQGKLAVVVGKPCMMSADGAVTHGKNQIVLMSK